MQEKKLGQLSTTGNTKGFSWWFFGKLRPVKDISVYIFQCKDTSPSLNAKFPNPRVYLNRKSQQSTACDSSPFWTRSMQSGWCHQESSVLPIGNLMARYHGQCKRTYSDICVLQSSQDHFMVFSWRVSTEKACSVLETCILTGFFSLLRD